METYIASHVIYFDTKNCLKTTSNTINVIQDITVCIL